MFYTLLLNISHQCSCTEQSSSFFPPKCVFLPKVTPSPNFRPFLFLLPQLNFLFSVWLISTTEKAIATHSSTLAWKIPWTEEPSGLQSMGLRRVLEYWKYWATSLSLFTFTHWRRKWQHSSVLAWRISGTAEPGGLPSTGSHRVRHDWSNLAAAAISTSYQVGGSQKPFAFIWARVDSSSLLLEVLTFEKDFWLPGWIFNWHDWRHVNKVKLNSWRWVAVFVWVFFFPIAHDRKLKSGLKNIYLCVMRRVFFLSSFLKFLATLSSPTRDWTCATCSGRAES